MLNEHIQFKGAGAIARARFNRLEKKNAITESMFDNLREAIEKSEAEADPAVRILVVASTGDNFTDFMRSTPSGVSPQPVAFCERFGPKGRQPRHLDPHP
jgi:1,4-dihydroxy-2-naphthoyl-CoA synthase